MSASTFTDAQDVILYLIGRRTIQYPYPFNIKEETVDDAEDVVVATGTTVLPNIDTNLIVMNI
jgi:hypothetical protein